MPNPLRIGFNRPFFLILAVLFIHKPHTYGDVPKPTDLPPGWWEYFDQAGDELEKKSSAFEDEIEKIPETLSEESQKDANALIQKIEANLTAYEEAVAQPPPQDAAPPPFSGVYSIQNIVELNRKLRRLNLELKSRQEERQSGLARLDNLQDLLDRANQRYNAAEVRSENRYFAGLNRILYRISLETQKKRLAISNQKLEQTRKMIAHLKEEIAVASSRLASNHIEIENLSNELVEAQRKLKQISAELRLQEAETTEQLAEKAGEDQQVLQDIYTQKLVQHQIRDALAAIEVMMLEVRLSLAQLITSPETFNAEQLTPKLQAWNKKLQALRQKFNAWESEARKSEERARQQLSLEQDEQQRENLIELIEINEANLTLLPNLGNSLDDARFLTGILDDKAIGLRGFGERWLSQVLFVIYYVAAETSDLLTSTLFYVGPHPVTVLSLLRFTFIMVLTFLLARFIVKGLNSLTRQRKGIRKAVMYRLNRLVQYLILFVGLIVALTSLGFDFSNLLIIAGALGVGLGFGLQSIFNNFVSGIIILFQGQLRVGDYVELDQNTRGEIREINVRSTVITTNEGIEVLVPNADMLSNQVVNWTLRDPYRRVRIPFGVAYGTDIDLVAKVIADAAKKIPSTLIKIGIPEPRVYLKEFGDSSLNFELVVWVNERSTRRMLRAKSAYLWTIHETLKKHSILIPYPQRVVHMHEREDS